MYTVNMFTVYMFTFQEGAALAFPELSPIGAPAAMREPFGRSVSRSRSAKLAAHGRAGQLVRACSV